MEKGKKKNEEWKNWLSDNLETLRDTQNGDFTNGHLYSYEKMREYDLGHTHWSVGNWESLLDEFSIDVVESFKEGAAKYWRAYKPELLSKALKEIAHHTRSSLVSLGWRSYQAVIQNG
ncbi:MAG: hypothetical protein R3F28_12590 [Candidatus Kapaibacterium sp.]